MGTSYYLSTEDSTDEHRLSLLGGRDAALLFLRGLISSALLTIISICSKEGFPAVVLVLVSVCEYLLPLSITGQYLLILHSQLNIFESSISVMKHQHI